MPVMLPAFYPIVDSAAWVVRLIGAGARLIQLRIKSEDEALIRQDIRAALTACTAHGAELVVNDHWQIALEERAPWLHLGQEDLDDADLAAIRASGIKLGISTHNEAELERALAFQPDYVALGPIFPTRSKEVGHAPQGLAQIRIWKARIGPLPLVAIGGITLEKAVSCRIAGADALAIISDVVLHHDPEARCRDWIATLETGAA